MRTNTVRDFAAEETGAGTAMGLFFLIAMIGTGGLALDVSHAMMMRTHLQVAADSAAHAALLARETKSETDAKTVALNVASVIMPASRFGDAINADDISFGSWDASAKVFTASSGSKTAVMVNTQQVASRNNSMGSYFLDFVGMDSWDIRRGSVFETYKPTCFREGFVADQIVDVQSNNEYKKGFCIHSNEHVEVNSNNSYEAGVIVSMPDIRDLVLPSSGFTSNDGLQASLRDGSYIIRVLERVNNFLDNMVNPTEVMDPDSLYYRPFINNSTVVVLDRKDKLETGWIEGRIHTVTCTAKSQKVQLTANKVLKNGVLVTNCQIQFGSSSGIENVSILTSNDDDDSITGANGFRIGKDDNCAVGGGAQIVTLGGVKYPASLEMYGGQILAMKDVQFAAQANGIEGASVVSQQTINGTSLMQMGVCDGVGMEYNFEADYYRLAM